MSETLRPIKSQQVHKVPKETFEQLARVCGLIVEEYSGNGAGWVHSTTDAKDSSGEYPLFLWSPFHNDGAALRLAVKLDMGIEVMKVLKEVRVGDGCGEIITEHYDDDPDAATRLAIVRCAAEIGKAMQ